MVAKKAVAQVFQPLHAVPGPWTGRGGGPEAVSVGVKDVGPPVAIQVAQADSAAAVVLVGRAPDPLRGEIAGAVVLEQVNLLPLLGNDGDNVLVAMSRHIRHAYIDGPRQLQKDVAAELPLADPLQPAYLALVVAKLRQHQVHFAVALQVGGAGI